MYFIARNNKIYNYIAYTKPIRRYLFTTGIIIFMISMAMISLYYITNISLISFLQEYGVLQQKYKELKQVEQKNGKLVIAIDEIKKELLNAVSTENPHVFFKQQFNEMLESAQQAGLKIGSYGSQKEKHEKWYKKEIAHLDVSGTLKQIMDFLSLIRNSQKMISVSRWSLIYLSADIFQLHCDIEFMFILA